MSDGIIGESCCCTFLALKNYYRIFAALGADAPHPYVYSSPGNLVVY